MKGRECVSGWSLIIHTENVFKQTIIDDGLTDGLRLMLTLRLVLFVLL